MAKKIEKTPKSKGMPKKSVGREQIEKDYAEVKKAAKQGQFLPTLLGKSLKLKQRISEANLKDSLTTSPDDQYFYFNLCGSLSEILYSFGQTKEAKDVVPEGEAVLDELSKLDQVKLTNAAQRSDLQLIRGKCRYALSFLVAQYYRSHRYQEFRDRTLHLQEILSHVHGLNDPETNQSICASDGTLGGVFEYLGKAATQLGLPEAQEYFAKAINYHQARRIRKIKELADSPEQLRIEHRFALYRTAICIGLGYGYLGFREGYQLKAVLYRDIMTAKSLLLFVRDEDINKTYLTLLEASIQRYLIGRVKKESQDMKQVQNDLGEVIEKLKAAKSVFQDLGHERYSARASFQLGLTYLYMNDFVRSYEEAKKVIEFAGQYDDDEWLCYGLTLRSRIERHRDKYQDAINTAREALVHSESKELIACKPEVLLTLGKALERAGTVAVRDGKDQIGRQFLRESREVMEKVLRLQRSDKTLSSPESPAIKFEAVALLNIAHSYLAESNLPEAERYIARWRGLKTLFDNRAVIQFADDIVQRFNDLKNQGFVIGADEKDLNFNTHKDALKLFLMRQAQKRTPNKKEQSSLLGINRGTEFNYRKKIEPNQKATQKLAKKRSKQQ